MALRKWSWFCLLFGLMGMNGLSRYAVAAEENRVPAISIEYQGLTPEFVAWLDSFDEKLEKILNIKR